MLNSIIALMAGGTVAIGTQDLEQRWTSTNCSTDLWNVSPPLNYSDEMYAGWRQLPTLTEVELYNGRRFNRTYAHHPQVAYFNETVYLIHTSGVVDEDSMGSEVWGAVSHDYGFTWTETTPYFPAALLPNQTSAETFEYWCNRSIWQRAWDGLTIVQSPKTQKVYAVADSTNFYCIEGESDTRGAGNIARVMDPSTGQPAGDPCWLTQNNWTDVTLYNETIYGTKWNMKFCEETDTLNALLATPPEIPAWDAILYNHKFYAIDGNTSLQEPTHAVYEQDYDQWRRLWRDISSKPSHKVWTECTLDPSSWYPLNYSANGPNPIYETNIPDVDAKQYYGTFSVPENDQVRYIVSNPRNNTAGARYPLSLAWQNYNATSANWQFTNVGVVKTGPALNPVPGRYKGIGFQYPSATQVGTNLIVTYSENKENIWLSVVPLGQI